MNFTLSLFCYKFFTVERSRRDLGLGKLGSLTLNNVNEGVSLVKDAASDAKKGRTVVKEKVKDKVKDSKVAGALVSDLKGLVPGGSGSGTTEAPASTTTGAETSTAPASTTASP